LSDIKPGVSLGVLGITSADRQKVTAQIIVVVPRK
jgi:hypothetical protein